MDFCSLGIPGVVAAYQNAISQVHLYGPTNVSPIINHVSMFASKAAQENKPSVSWNQNIKNTKLLAFLLAIMWFYKLENKSSVKLCLNI